MDDKGMVMGHCGGKMEEKDGMDHMMWHGDEYDKVDMMMWLAKKAKMELLKEKMKKKLEAVEGKKMDRVADLIVNAMLGMQRMKMEGMEKKEDLMDKVEEIWLEE